MCAPTWGVSSRNSSLPLTLGALAAVAMVACGDGSGRRIPFRPPRRVPQATAPVTFVQVAYATPQSNTASVTVKYAAAQTAGNLNVVAVGWNDTTAAVT